MDELDFNDVFHGGSGAPHSHDPNESFDAFGPMDDSYEGESECDNMCMSPK